MNATRKHYTIRVICTSDDGAEQMGASMRITGDHDRDLDGLTRLAQTINECTEVAELGVVIQACEVQL